MRRLPWVGLPTDSTVLGHHRFAVAGEKYVRALAIRMTRPVMPMRSRCCVRLWRRIFRYWRSAAASRN